MEYLDFGEESAHPGQMDYRKKLPNPYEPEKWSVDFRKKKPSETIPTPSVLSDSETLKKEALGESYTPPSATKPDPLEGFDLQKKYGIDDLTMGTAEQVYKYSNTAFNAQDLVTRASSGQQPNDWLAQLDADTKNAEDQRNADMLARSQLAPQEVDRTNFDNLSAQYAEMLGLQPTAPKLETPKLNDQDTILALLATALGGTGMAPTALMGALGGAKNRADMHNQQNQADFKIADDQYRAGLSQAAQLLKTAGIQLSDDQDRALREYTAKDRALGGQIDDAQNRITGNRMQKDLYNKENQKTLDNLAGLVKNRLGDIAGWEQKDEDFVQQVAKEYAYRTGEDLDTVLAYIGKPNIGDKSVASGNLEARNTQFDQKKLDDVAKRHDAQIKNAQGFILKLAQSAGQWTESIHKTARSMAESIDPDNADAVLKVMGLQPVGSNALSFMQYDARNKAQEWEQGFKEKGQTMQGNIAAGKTYKDMQEESRKTYFTPASTFNQDLAGLAGAKSKTKDKKKLEEIDAQIASKNESLKVWAEDNGLSAFIRLAPDGTLRIAMPKNREEIETLQTQLIEESDRLTAAGKTADATRYNDLAVSLTDVADRLYPLAPEWSGEAGTIPSVPNWDESQVQPPRNGMTDPAKGSGFAPIPRGGGAAKATPPKLPKNPPPGGAKKPAAKPPAAKPSTVKGSKGNTFTMPPKK